MSKPINITKCILATLGAVLVLSSSLLAGEPTTLEKLTHAEIVQQLDTLPDWHLENQQLRRTYTFENFVESVEFVNRLVEPAETVGHHPDLAISYNQVTVSLTTHDAGGLTQKDFDLVRTISRLAVEQGN